LQPLIVVAVLALETLVRSLTVWVVVLLIAVVLVVHVLGILLSLVLRTLAVDIVGTFSLGKAIDFDTGETDEKLFGELVGDWLA
jgi:hypothetical protein